MSIATACLLLGVALQVEAQTNEGVRVRGHWTITIRNVDGSVAERTEFDNHLMPGGALVIGQLLAQSPLRFSSWQIRLSAVSKVAEAPMFGEGNEAILYKGDGKHPSDSRPSFSSLQQTGLNFGVELTGSATALHEGVLTRVATQVVSCFFNEPNPCSNVVLTFTETAAPDRDGPAYGDGSPMPDGIHLHAGQSIEVTVQITVPYAQ
jgi:hypothetical protein